MSINRKKNIVFISLVSLIFVFVIIHLVFWGEKNMLDKHQSTYLSFGCFIVNDKNERMISPVAVIKEDLFNEKFRIMVSSNKDVKFDVILLSNYEQIPFSINGSEEKNKHTIFINKSLDKKTVSSNIQIKSTNIKTKSNDCVLIFTRKDSDDNYNLVRNTYAYRFSVLNEYSNINSVDINILKEPKAIKGTIDDVMAIFDRDFNEIKTNHYENYEMINKQEDAKRNTPIALPTVICLENLVKDSKFYDKYLQECSSNQKYKLLIFAIVNGELHPLTIEGEDKTFHVLESELGSTIMLTPSIMFDKEGVYSLYLMTAVYPFEFNNDYLGTYKMMYWSSIVSSQRVLFNVGV